MFKSPFRLGFSFMLLLSLIAGPCALAQEAPFPPATAPAKPDPKAWKKLREQGRKALTEENFPEAGNCFRTALAEAETFGPKDSRLAESLMDLGVFEARMDNYSVAEPLFRRAETVTEGAFPLLESQCALSLGALCQRMAHLDEAEKFYTRAGELLARRLGAEHPEVFICQYYLATVCDAKGDYARAEQLLKGCASYFSNPPPRFKTRKLDPTFYNDQVYRGPFQPNYVYAADSLNRLARIYQWQNRAADAEACLTESLKLADANLPKGDPEIQAALDRLVGYQLAQRNYPGAETVLVEFLKSREKVLGTDHGMILRANETLASVYEMENKHAEAEALRKRIREMPRK